MIKAKVKLLCILDFSISMILISCEIIENKNISVLPLTSPHHHESLRQLGVFEFLGRQFPPKNLLHSLLHSEFPLKS